MLASLNESLRQEWMSEIEVRRGAERSRLRGKDVGEDHASMKKSMEKFEGTYTHDSLAMWKEHW